MWWSVWWWWWWEDDADPVGERFVSLPPSPPAVRSRISSWSNLSSSDALCCDWCEPEDMAELREKDPLLGECEERVRWLAGFTVMMRLLLFATIMSVTCGGEVVVVVRWWWWLVCMSVYVYLVVCKIWVKYFVSVVVICSTFKWWMVLVYTTSASNSF